MLHGSCLYSAAFKIEDDFSMSLISLLSLSLLSSIILSLTVPLQLVLKMSGETYTDDAILKITMYKSGQAIA